MPETEQLYKVLNTDGSCYHGGQGRWYLPDGENPGEWMPTLRGELEPCVKGYHVLRVPDLVYWIGPALWTVEYEGDRIDGDDKVVVRKARILARVETWNDRILRLFACDCAERVLSHAPNPDPRSINAIIVARRFANGEATAAELLAAWDAAEAAAEAAAETAAWAAAEAAAWDAAWAAAWADAGAATGTAERAWQTQRLMSYIHGEE